MEADMAKREERQRVQRDGRSEELDAFDQEALHGDGKIYHRGAEAQRRAAPVDAGQSS